MTFQDLGMRDVLQQPMFTSRVPPPVPARPQDRSFDQSPPEYANPPLPPRPVGGFGVAAASLPPPPPQGEQRRLPPLPYDPSKTRPQPPPQRVATPIAQADEPIAESSSSSSARPGSNRYTSQAEAYGKQAQTTLNERVFTAENKKQASDMYEGFRGFISTKLGGPGRDSTTAGAGSSVEIPLTAKEQKAADKQAAKAQKREDMLFKVGTKVAAGGIKSIARMAKYTEAGIRHADRDRK